MKIGLIDVDGHNFPNLLERRDENFDRRLALEYRADEEPRNRVQASPDRAGLEGSRVKTMYFIAVAFAAASVYLNKKSDAWADRCLFLAYGTLALVVGMIGGALWP